MPDDTDPPHGETEVVENVPLYLVPRTVADLIRKKGKSVYRILVLRKNHHRYAVSVETAGAPRAGEPGASDELVGRDE